MTTTAVLDGGLTLDAVGDLRLIGLLGPASRGRLILYTGAGISLDVGLPTGAGLSQAIYDQLTVLGIPLAGIDAQNLLAVADVVEKRQGGLPALQTVALDAFPFTTAGPSPTHRALALLILEGAIQLLTTNWDTCVERAGTPERIATVVTTSERMQYQDDSVLKLHGCASRRDTLLLTTAQLDEAPLWAQTEIKSALSHSTVVFLGIGDVAPYVQRGLEQIVDELGPASHVRVVSPTIEADWDTTKWAGLLPTLPADNRWSLGAEVFACGLLAAWVNNALHKIRGVAHGTGVASAPDAFDQLHAMLRRHRAELVLSWLRRSRFRPEPGDGIAHSGRTTEGLVALALHTRADAVANVPNHGPVLTASGPVELLMAPDNTTGVQLAAEAFRRASEYRQQGLLGPADSLTVLCVGQIGPLPTAPGSSLAGDVMGEDDDGIISGGSVRLLTSNDVNQAAA